MKTLLRRVAAALMPLLFWGCPVSAGHGGEAAAGEPRQELVVEPTLGELPAASTLPTPRALPALPAPHQPLIAAEDSLGAASAAEDPLGAASAAEALLSSRAPLVPAASGPLAPAPLASAASGPLVAPAPLAPAAASGPPQEAPLGAPGAALAALGSRDTKTPPERLQRAPGVNWGLSWTGSWEDEGNLTNRADLRLSFTDITLRGEALDRRAGQLSAPVPGQAKAKANMAFLGGLYHPASGSRLLYGPLEDWGLAARLRSPWSRGLPFAESRKSSTADLRTSPSTKDSEIYAYLGNPALKLPPGRQLRGLGAARLNPAKLEDGPQVTAGLEGRLDKIALNLVGFFTTRKLPAREASAWFSAAPPLPARSFKLYGLGALLSVPYVSLSTDWAWSETFAYGSDLYANLGLRAGNKGMTNSRGPHWQLSLTADGAGPRYTGSDGANPGAGFRSGGKFEWQQEKWGLFRINTSLSGPGLGEEFNRSSSGLYYRPPAATLPLRLSRISVTADRDARDSSHIKDSVGLSLGLAVSPQDIINSITTKGALALSLSGSLTGVPAAKTGAAAHIPPWPLPHPPHRFESAKAGGQLSWSTGSPQGNLQLKAGLDYTMTANTPEDDGKDAFTEGRDLTLSATLRGKRNQVGIKISCPDFRLPAPETPDASSTTASGTATPKDTWKLTVSWKLEW
jgi:hypothetical protein